MDHLIERPCNQREYYDYTNNTGATLTQFHFCLWVNPATIGLPVLGNIPDHNGIVDGATGKIESQVGSRWQICADQLADEVTTQAVNTVIYMAPGAGNIHVTPVEGDYKIGYITVAQGTNTYIEAQLTPPERVTDDEIAT